MPSCWGFPPFKVAFWLRRKIKMNSIPPSRWNSYQDNAVNTNIVPEFVPELLCTGIPARKYCADIWRITDRKHRNSPELPELLRNRKRNRKTGSKWRLLLLSKTQQSRKTCTISRTTLASIGRVFKSHLPGIMCNFKYYGYQWHPLRWTTTSRTGLN